MHVLLFKKLSALLVTAVLFSLISCGTNNSAPNSNLNGSDKSELQDDDLGKAVQKSYATIRARHADNVKEYDEFSKNPEQGIKETIKLSVLNYNLGLLHVFGGLVGVPYYNERSSALAINLDRMKAQGVNPDVIFFQELWYDQDRTQIVDWAAKNGYSVALNNETSAKWHGLNILVRKSILANNADLTDCIFTKIGSAEIGRSTNRGLLSCYARLSGGSLLSLNTTHLTFGFGKDESLSREEKLDVIAKDLNGRAQMASYVLFGGDFNLSPEFSDAKPEEKSGWASNRRGYVRFVDRTEGTKLIDTYIAVNTDFGYTQDRDKNSLTKISSSTKSEPEQRLDYVWAGSTYNSHGVIVHKSQLSFTWDAVKADNMTSLNTPFSDHFGVLTELTFYKKAQ